MAFIPMGHKELLTPIMVERYLTLGIWSELGHHFTSLKTIGIKHGTVANFPRSKSSIYVGDAELLKPSGKTNALRVDFEARGTSLQNWLLRLWDINYTICPEVPKNLKGQDYISLSPQT